MDDGGGMTMESAFQLGGWGLAIGTCFFGALGINAGKDFFLLMGCVILVLGNAAYMFMVHEQTGEDQSNETLLSVFTVFTGVSIYAAYRQWDRFRLEGCGDDDDEDEEEEAASGKAGSGGQQTKQQLQGGGKGASNSLQPTAAELLEAYRARHGGEGSSSGSGNATAAPASAAGLRKRQ